MTSSGDGKILKVVNTPPVGVTNKKIDLRNAGAIRRELASVYRDMRSGTIEPSDGTKLAYVLKMLGDAYERYILEQRLEALEVEHNQAN